MTARSDKRELRLHIQQAMSRVERVLREHFTDLLDAVKAALAVVAVGCLSDNRQPSTLIFVAPASAGKSQALSFLMPGPAASDPLAKRFYRSDHFTAASFVSHRADVSAKKLGKIDLLPRLEGKTLLTKELAPLFSGKREDLLKTFSVLTAILDGQGYISDSGSHGRRGYDKPINFQWLGATTPLSNEVLQVMAQLGPRMLFFDVDRPRRSVDDLTELLLSGSGEQGKKACASAVRELLLAFYRRYPSKSAVSVEFPGVRLHTLALWADVLTRLRATIRGEGIERQEHAERVLGILRNVALGSALIHGRLEVDDYDMALVAHITISSGVAMRGRVLLAVLRVGGTAKTETVAKIAGISVPTALRYMNELGVVGIADFNEGAGRSPARVQLRSPYTDLGQAPLLKAKRGEGEKGDA